MSSRRRTSYSNDIRTVILWFFIPLMPLVDRDISYIKQKRLKTFVVVVQKKEVV